MPDNEKDPKTPDGWEEPPDYTVEITLPDGSTVSQTSDGTEDGKTSSTLRDRDGNPVSSWDSDTEPNDRPRFDKDPDAPPDDKGFFEPVLPHDSSSEPEKTPEPALQRYWRLKREGKDPGPDPRTEAGTAEPEKIVIGGVDEEIKDAISWFRKGPVRLPLLIAIGGGLILIGWFFISQDDDPVLIDTAGELPVVDEDEQPAPETEAEAEAETEVEKPPEVDEVSSRIPSGTTDIVGLIDSTCGGLYSVFLLARVFDGQGVTVDQLDRENGNPLQTATGWSNSRISMAIGGDESFYEVWFFIWNAGNILNIYNVYGLTADFVAPESVADLDRFADVASADDLLAAVNGSADSCAAEVAIEATTSTDLLGSDS